MKQQCKELFKPKIADKIPTLESFIDFYNLNRRNLDTLLTIWDILPVTSKYFSGIIYEIKSIENLFDRKYKINEGNLLMKMVSKEMFSIRNRIQTSYEEMLFHKNIESRIKRIGKTYLQSIWRDWKNN